MNSLTQHSAQVNTERGKKSEGSLFGILHTFYKLEVKNEHVLTEIHEKSINPFIQHYILIKRFRKKWLQIEYLKQIRHNNVSFQSNYFTKPAYI